MREDLDAEGEPILYALPSESDDEDPEAKAKEEQKKQEPPKPTVYNCGACTMENDINLGTCDICGTGRPAME